MEYVLSTRRQDCIVLAAFLFSLTQVSYGQHWSSRGNIYQGPFYPVPPPGQWSAWAAWSSCSRTCGLGIKTRARRCLGYDSAACGGDKEEYATCSSKPCARGIASFRDYQCSLHNGKKVLGRKISAWESYLSNLAPCDLRCKAKDVTFYYGFGPVLDGTKCNDETHDVCIKGKCQKVGCDGRVGSSLIEDMCLVCGGRNDTCSHFQSIFYTDDTETVSGRRHGYEAIATVPAGATHITVTDNSDNYLAVADERKKYIINGDWSITWPGRFHVAGTDVQYERDWENKETIRMTGPTTEVVHLMVLLRSSNPGITYSYWLPKQQSSVGRNWNTNIDTRSGTVNDNRRTDTSRRQSNTRPDTVNDNGRTDSNRQGSDTRFDTVNDHERTVSSQLRKVPGYPHAKAALTSASSEKTQKKEEENKENSQRTYTRDGDYSYNQRLNEYAKNYRQRYHRTTLSTTKPTTSTTAYHRPSRSQYDRYGRVYNNQDNRNSNYGTSTKDRLYVYRGYNNFRPGKYIYQRNYGWTSSASSTKKQITETTTPIPTTTTTQTTTTTTPSTTTVPIQKDILGFTLDDSLGDLIIDPYTGKCFKCPHVRDWQAEFCDSDFVIRAKVNGEVKTRGEMRYDISVVQTYKTTIPMLPREYVWVPNLCGCPKLRTNVDYIMMGKSVIHGREVRLEVNHKSLVREFGRRYAIYMRNVKAKTNCETYKRRSYY